MRKVGLLLFTLIVLSCSSNEENRSISQIDFSNPQLIDENIQDWIHIEKSNQLAIPDSIPIGRITQVEFTESELVMLEVGISTSILVFDREGVFQRQLHKQGTGPGEYAQIEFFVLRDDSILVYDRSQQKLIT
jgi:hypothetical protein